MVQGGEVQLGLEEVHRFSLNVLALFMFCLNDEDVCGL